MRYCRIVAVFGLAIMALASSTVTSSAQDDGRPDASVPAAGAMYLGQEPPGEKAELFAPDVLTHEPHGSPIIAQDEVWMLIATFDGLKYYKMIDGKLTATTNPMGFEISGILNALAVSPTEQRVYFLIWEDTEDDFYFIEKQAGTWTSQAAVGEGFTPLDPFWQFSIAKNENLYFAARGIGIYVSVYDGESHLIPKQLLLENDGIFEGESPFIAPDESYLVFSKDDDLYISYNLQNGKWSMPQNLGPDINSDKKDLCPKISPNGKYLFFSSRRNVDWAIFWAKADFIEDLKPESLK